MEKFSLEFPPMDEGMFLNNAFGISSERDAEITKHLESGKDQLGDTINIVDIVNHAVEIATSYEEAYYIIMKTALSLGKSIERIEARRNNMKSLFGALLGGGNPFNTPDNDGPDDDDDDSVPSFKMGKA